MRFKIFLTILIVLVLTVGNSALVRAQQPPVTAEGLEATIPNYPIKELWQKYCDDRKGNVINLQTWYSGKCTGDPKDPEAIGFSDIVLLDFYTLLQGEPGQSVLGQGGALPFVGSLIVSLYEHPPASTVNYVAYIRDNLAKHSIVKPAYAQGPGYGFEGLSPILPLWRGFRNITYLLFTLAFVAYGFAIMFRFKLGSQAAVTIQTAIPQLIFVLLLISFSYAIAALLIDLMYVVIGVIMGVLASQNFISAGILQTWGIGQVSLFEFFFRFILHAIFGLVNNLIIALTGLSGPLLTVANIFVAGIFGIFFAIFIVLVSLYVLVKVLFMLLGAMVNVLLQVIFSPFILLPAVFPGQKVVGNWIRTIVANLAVFPAIITMFAFSFIFLGKYQGAPFGLSELTDFNLPIEENARILAFPILGATLFHNPNPEARPVLALVGFGFFLLTPKVAEAIKKALNAPGGEFGSAILEPLKGGYGYTPSGSAGGAYSAGRGMIGKALGIPYDQRKPADRQAPPKPQAPSQGQP